MPRTRTISIFRKPATTFKWISCGSITLSPIPQYFTAIPSRNNLIEKMDYLFNVFRRARFEFRPELPDGQRVVLADLGSLYFEKLSEDPALKDPSQPLNASTQPATTSIQLRAFVWKAVTVETDQQTIYIIANDQSGRSFNNSSCTATVHWPNDSAQVIGAATNSSGIAIIHLSFANKPWGSLIPIDINCGYENLNGGTTTSFRIWY